MLNLHHLRIFQIVAAHESYSRAAERLGISQPAVSMQIGKLEEALGISLVAVKGRRVVLTEAGHELARHAQRLFAVHDEAEQALDDLKNARKGRLRLAASSTPGAYVLPGAVAAFKSLHPAVVVTLQISNTLQAMRAVADGHADLAVVGEAPVDGPEVELVPLWPDHLTVVVHPAHPWAQGQGGVTARDLALQPLVLREEGSSTREALDRRLAALGLKARVALELGSTEAVREAVAAGLGAAVLSGLAVRGAVAAGLLVAVQVTDLALERQMHLALPHSGSLTAAVQRFAAQLGANLPNRHGT